MSAANASKGIFSLYRMHGTKPISTSRNNNYYTYILKCSDSSYYVGSTDDIERRVARHNAGRGPRWTNSRLPVQLVYYEMHKTQEQAGQRERQIKKWSRAKKEALIGKEIETLKSLSVRKQK